jgi:hypothetical protein
MVIWPPVRVTQYAALAPFRGVLNVILSSGGIFAGLGVVAPFLLRLAGGIVGVSV